MSPYGKRGRKMNIVARRYKRQSNYTAVVHNRLTFACHPLTKEPYVE